MADLTTYAPAKINLGLRVLRRRDDGYHDIDTVFVAIGWTDRLTMRVEEGAANLVSMTCSDRSLPTNESNLCVRAALALRSAVEQERAGSGEAVPALPPVHIHLEKHIPHGAGLGGGSSNAAAVLRGLTELWSVDAATMDLPTLAARLGADVPFFLDPVPSRATGIGEKLEPLGVAASSEASAAAPDTAAVEGAPHAPPFHWTVIVVVPDVCISTAEAYRLVTPNNTDRLDLAQAVTTYPPAAWRGLVKNDFEPVVSRKHPEITAIREHLDAEGALYSAMSGSGSAVYGLFDIGSERAYSAYISIRNAFPSARTWVGTTITA